jgi:hypothetical protein
MANKCEFCKEKITEDEMGKLAGTIVKVKLDEKNEHKYVCKDCQKKGLDKELLEKKK